MGKKALISGAGVGGATLAYWLARTDSTSRSSNGPRANAPAATPST